MDILIKETTPITAVTAPIKMGLNERNNSNLSFSSEETDTIEQAAHVNTDIWSELAEEYDIRNSSFYELCDISTRLYQAGQIYLFDHVMLTYNPNKAKQPVKPGIYLTEESTDGRRDWIIEYQARAAEAMKTNNKIASKVIKNILKILERLSNK